MSVDSSTDLLAAIVAATRASVAIRKDLDPQAVVARRAAGRRARGDEFHAALARTGAVNVIAECKRRSPSRGVLRAEYDPAAIASAYAAAGAAAISVLTEPSFFDGALAHLDAVSGAVRTPVLRKDFIVDPYQVLEARAHGAAAVLLIVAALTDTALRDLRGVAEDQGLAALVEVHDRIEIDRALAAGATMIGVNNRNLRTLHVDTEASFTLVEHVPDGCIAVAESGLQSGDDIRRLRAVGYDAFLIGERVMTAPDPGDALRALIAGAGGAGREAARG